MKLAIIGARGALGSELARRLAPDRPGLFDLPQCDVTRPDSLDAALGATPYDAIINLASYNRVDDAERDPAQAIAVNAEGAGHLARLAAARNTPVCYVSTDYVFGSNADRRTPYTEADQPGPVNAYGRSKRAGEQQVLDASPANLVVRTSSLFARVASRKGHSFPELMLDRAAAGEPIRVVNDQVMSPTFAADLAARLIELVHRGARGIVHASNSGHCSWYEFAMEIFRQAGLSPDLSAISSAELGRAATRPRYSVMACARLDELGLAPLRPWPEALGDYLAGREGD